MWLLIGAGGLLAGLSMLVRAAAPLLKAHWTGEIHTSSARPRKIERAIEPERFNELFAQRSRGLGVGAVVILAAVGWLALNALGLLMEAR